MTNLLDTFRELIRLPVRDSDILWMIIPLLLATIIMFLYFQKYKEEELGWNGAVANSLVSIFVSIALLRYIYFLTPLGILNLTDNLSRTIFSVVLLILGFVLLIVNFEHFLPKKTSYYISSPLTINLIAYIVIVFVYSNLDFNFTTLLVLVLLFAILRILLYLIQRPIQKLFSHIQYLKDQEKVEDVKKEQRVIKKEKREIKKKETKVKKAKIKELNKEKKKIQKAKNIVVKKGKK
jgi:hypothetical protein